MINLFLLLHFPHNNTNLPLDLQTKLHNTIVKRCKVSNAICLNIFRRLWHTSIRNNIPNITITLLRSLLFQSSMKASTKKFWFWLHNGETSHLMSKYSTLLIATPNMSKKLTRECLEAFIVEYFENRASQ